MIHSAKLENAVEIAALWNVFVKNTTATFRSEEVQPKDVEALIEKCREENYPFLIAHNESLLGFALYKQFRLADGYRHTMEHSIYLDKAARGRGIGRKLMQALELHAKRQDVHSFIGGVTADNHESIAFHEKLGFRATGKIPQVARKFDQWHDIVFMQKILEE